MIPNQWYAVLESREVPKNKLVGVTRFGERLVFWRSADGSVVCLRDQCVHRGAALSAGKSVGGRAQCPFHGFQYDSAGRVTLIPADGRNAPVPDYFKVRSYPTAERHAMILVWWGEVPEHLPEVPAFTDLQEPFPSTTSRHLWPVHYSRAVENQLDLVHLPFVHYDTIGRGNRTLVNGPVELVTGNREIEFWVYNEVDRGQKPKSAHELPTPDPKRQHIHFLFPNLWQNWITPALRVFVAFAPVDDAHTMIYLRMYQRYVTVPVLASIVNYCNMRFGIKILNQDRRVVVTQRPISSRYGMDEKLIHGDLPIITYRRIRETLQSGKTPERQS